MKTKDNQFGKWGVTLLFALFICACSPPVSMSPELPNGFGSFSLIVENGSRTILPTAPTTGSFAVYTLAFTATSGGTSKSEDRTNATLATSPVILAVGTYTLTVSAYLDAGKTKLAARGTETGIVIGSGANVAKTVTLKALSDTGNGTFSYNVTISAPNVTSATMAITKNGAAISGSPVTLNNTGATSGSLTLAVGVYNLRFTLVKGGAVKEEAVWNEILYVYAELTSNFTINFNDDYFYRTHYNVTFNYNYTGAPAAGTQSVMHGGALTAPTAPTREGYNFGGWHTDPDPDSTDLYVFTTPVYKDFTLYAKWVVGPAGTGTQEDPFLVRNETELRYVGRGTENSDPSYQDWTLTAHYKQTANITLPSVAAGQSNWTRIGNSSFTGSYNGGGHTITGLTIDTTASEQGMFRYIGSVGKVENLGLIGINIKSTSTDIGGIVGISFGTIQNCYVTGSVTGGNGRVGGIVGTIQSGAIQNCYVAGSVTGAAGQIGGIAGRIEDSSGTIRNCYVTGSIYGTTSYVGGIVGINYGSVLNCVALNQSVDAMSNIGRVGYNNATLNNNYAWSDMTLRANGSPMSPTGTTRSGIGGESITAAQAKDNSWWTTAGNWNTGGIGAWDFTTVWQLNGANGMPSLRVFGTVQPWPGYLVDPPTNWTAVTDSTFGTSIIQSIAYGDGKFVAGGYDGKMAYSTDGINWNTVNSTFGTTEIYGIAYGDGKFVAVGFYGRMAYSTDGVNWTAISNTNNTFGTSHIRGITWDGGKFVTVGQNGKMAYSTDGINWTAYATINSTSYYYCIAYGGGTFVVGDSNYGRMAYSSDGVTWTIISSGVFDTNGYINSIAWNGNRFVAVGNGGRMGYSADGTTWNTVSNSTFGTSSVIQGIAYGNGRFVAVGWDGKMAYSSDGVNWTAISATNSTFGTSIIYCIAYGDGKFVAGGGGGKIAVCTP